MTVNERRGNGLELTLQQKQSQNLTMTVELRQAIELLQYSTYDLYEYLKEQELENPLIELEMQTADDFYKNKENRNGNGNFADASKSPFDFIKSDDIGMREKLIEQAMFIFKKQHDQQLVRFLLYNIDDNGYLSLQENEMFFDEHELTRGIHLLQQLGPIGIGARNLKECLLLQIAYAHPEQYLAEVLIENHLELLANRRWNDLASHMDLSLDQVKEVTDFIKTLNPRPCSSLTNFSAQYLYPDIIITNGEDGVSFRLNEHYLPKIRLTNHYISSETENHETKKYLKEKVASYHWLMSSLEQRRQTITKIMHIIIQKQEKFFKEGFIGLQPLILKDVADEIGMHESTVSRATMNKVVQTPKGTFDLRMFFTTKLETANGEDISQSKVKTLLQNLIDNENKQKPLSDQKIADYFKTEENITVSRRTISKYREELNIPTSRMRKEI